MLRRIGTAALVLGAVGLLGRAAGPAVSAQDSDGPEVRTLERGAEPRRKLRYSYSEGMHEEMVMDMDMSMKMSMGAGRSPRIDIPTMRMKMGIDAERVHGNGDLRYTFDTKSAELVGGGGNARMKAMLQQQLDKVTGISGWVRVSTRGVTRDANVSVPSGSGQQLQRLVKSMRRSMRQMSAPLPKEAVGVGAKWEVKMPIEMKGIEVQQTAVYELQELDGDTGKLAIQVEQTAEPQPIDAPGLPPSANVHLESMKTDGSGQMRFDLGRLTPESAMEMSTRVKSKVQMQGRSRRMETEMGIDAEIRPGS